MTNLGTGEIFIVAIVLFILFGGKKLPELAKGLGEAGRQFNSAFKGEDEKAKNPPPPANQPPANHDSPPPETPSSPPPEN